MSISLNKVYLLGNVGKDPDIRFLPDGTRVVSFSLATSEMWKDKVSGERKEKTEWHKIVAFSDRIADICEKYVRKGSKLYVEGQIQTRKWTDSNNIDRYTTEVVISRFKGDIILLDARRNSGDTQVEHDIIDSHVDEAPADIPLDDDMPF
ncbi:MAG: single-stranded DNA-binding protein [Holosporales bacterium]|jgi:single-strand DNA-binding protein|nr:single-stranded DNA-binding protein [Holosporales bacterium]